jgi:hypothetical protein
VLDWIIEIVVGLLTPRVVYNVLAVIVVIALAVAAIVKVV